jgi:transcriptional regulator of acetoin/glycerol metabolism
MGNSERISIIVSSKKSIDEVSESVQKLFMDYFWPGNVRELEHALEHAFIVCHANVITREHLSSALKEPQPAKAASVGPGGGDGARTVLEALEKTGWNKSKAARLLGIGRMTLYRKIQEYNLTED